MSWREVLGASAVADVCSVHYPHNAQNQGCPDNFANTAEIALGTNLRSFLATAVQERPITAEEVMDSLAAKDVEGWYSNEISADRMRAIVESLAQRHEMNSGHVPEHYTEVAHCKGCGPVWLWFAGDVLGCPWCWNRAKGHPIPRPE